MNRAIEDEGVSTSSSRVEATTSDTADDELIDCSTTDQCGAGVGTTTCGVVGTSTEIETNVGSCGEVQCVTTSCAVDG